MICTRLRREFSDPAVAGDFLAAKLPLSRSKIRDVMNKGGVWLQQERLRRVHHILGAGEELAVFYDPDRLAKRALEIDLIEDCQHYSIWHKPAMMPLLGDDWADFDSFLRNVTLACHQQRPIILFANLTTIEAGAVLVAHSQRAAQQLAAKINQGKISWQLRAELIGSVASQQLAGDKIEVNISAPAYNTASGRSKVLLACRLKNAVENPAAMPVIAHARQLLAAHDLAVVGDPEFAQDQSANLKLRVTGLAFAD